MNAYNAFVEAQGYGDVEAESAALETALNDAELGDAVTFTVMADEIKGMLLVHLQLEGVDAVDAHELAMTVWGDAWTAAFEDQAPTSVLGVRCTPAGGA